MKLRRMPYFERGPDGKNERKLSGKFYAVWQDYTGVLRRLPLFDDRKASEEMARKIDKLNSLRAAGETIPPDLGRFVETMPPSIREKLARWDILPASRVTAGKPLADHLDDWKASLTAKGNTAAQVELVTARARRAFELCGSKFWNDISATKLQTKLAELRQNRVVELVGGKKKTRRGISNQTFNFYLAACKQFGLWMICNGRASESPLAHLKGLNVKTDRRHDRRALTNDELRWLLALTDGEPVRNGMTGTERATVYRLAVETGLRANEIRSLTRSSFSLEGDDPSVTVLAAYNKRRRQDTQPLRTDTANVLADYLAGKMPAAIAFSMPDPEDVAPMFRADLAAARTAWLQAAGGNAERQEREQSTFLAYRDDAGRVIDFHALRHTFISNLASGGVHPKTAQQLARHSTITLTMDRYTHVRSSEIRGAIDVLPTITKPAERAIATGTDGKTLSPGLSPRGTFPCASVRPVH